MANRVSEAGIAAFLAALAETGMVREALARSGTPKASMYRRRKTSKRFAAAWDDALAIGLDQLRDEAVRRALNGVERPVFHGGRQVGTVRSYSDALLMFLLRAHQPARYREPVRGAAASPGLNGVADDSLAALLRAIDGNTRGLPRQRGEYLNPVPERPLPVRPPPLPSSLPP